MCNGEAVIARRFACVLMAVWAGLSVSGMTNAADYPSRPLRLIVPFPPAGGTDIVGRVMAQQIGRAHV